MEILALNISNIPLSWLISIAILLIIIDIFLINSAILLIIGVALIPISILNFLELNPYIQLWSYPIFLLLCSVFFTRIIAIFQLSENPYAGTNYEGQIGRIIISETEHDSGQFFYKDKNLIRLEQEKNNEISKIVKVRLKSGQVLNTTGNVKNLKNGDEVQIIKIDGNAAEISKI